MTSALRDNTALSRFELDVESHIAFANYRPMDGAWAIVHTEVPYALRERGIGSQLVRAVLEHARAQRMKIAPYCGFVRHFMAEHPEFNDVRR